MFNQVKLHFTNQLIVSQAYRLQLWYTLPSPQHFIMKHFKHIERLEEFYSEYSHNSHHPHPTINVL